MTNPNDPAFSDHKLIGQGNHGPVFSDKHEGGLTKREYFAAVALQGLLAGSQGETKWHETNFAIGAINIADALIAELNK